MKFSQMMLRVQQLPVTINQPAQALAATYTTVNAIVIFLQLVLL
jgi:hypothetical protein